jgi:hypothetical protein
LITFLQDVKCCKQVIEVNVVTVIAKFATDCSVLLHKRRLNKNQVNTKQQLKNLRFLQALKKADQREAGMTPCMTRLLSCTVLLAAS